MTQKTLIDYKPLNTMRSRRDATPALRSAFGMMSNRWNSRGRQLGRKRNSKLMPSTKRFATAAALTLSLLLNESSGSSPTAAVSYFISIELLLSRIILPRTESICCIHHKSHFESFNSAQHSLRLGLPLVQLGLRQRRCIIRIGPILRRVVLTAVKCQIICCWMSKVGISFSRINKNAAVRTILLLY